MWEQAEEVPPAKRRGRSRLELAPGEVRRRIHPKPGTSSNYNVMFRQQGRTDYHAANRTVDNVRYLYIWRDA